MYLKQVVLFVFIYFNYCYCASTRVWHYKNCGKQGFTCTTRNRRTSIIYQCPVKNKEYHVYVNEFNGPSNLESLTIKNCRTLKLLFRCTKYKWEKKYLKYLEVSNVKKLKIQHLPDYHSQLPPTVVFKNIGYIETIPSFSFSQTDSRRNKAGCILPTNAFHSISFHNVSIGTVHSNAFYMPHKFGNVTFTDVRINNLRTSSMKVNHHKDGVFLMHQSTVKVLDPSALQIVGKKAIFSESKFTSISSSGINATVESFYFVNNSADALHPYALSVLSTNVYILKNRFDYLRSGAFERIGPGSINNSEGKFGMSKFSYNFNDNYIDSVSYGYLYPVAITFKNISSDVSVKRNSLNCSCFNSGWLISKADYIDDSFYKDFFDKTSENTCSSSCKLPVRAAKDTMKGGMCLQNVTVEWLCKNRNKPTTTLETFTMSPTRAQYTSVTGRMTRLSPIMSTYPAFAVTTFPFEKQSTADSASVETSSWTEFKPTTDGLATNAKFTATATEIVTSPPEKATPTVATNTNTASQAVPIITEGPSTVFSARETDSPSTDFKSRLTTKLNFAATTDEIPTSPLFESKLTTMDAFTLSTLSSIPKEYVTPVTSQFRSRLSTKSNFATYTEGTPTSPLFKSKLTTTAASTLYTISSIPKEYVTLATSQSKSSTVTTTVGATSLLDDIFRHRPNAVTTPISTTSMLPVTVSEATASIPFEEQNNSHRHFVPSFLLLLVLSSFVVHI